MAPLVKQAFEMMATGDYSSDTVRQFVTAGGLRTKKGHKLTRQTFSTVLKNPVYCGLIIHTGHTYKRSFPTLLSENLWHNVQNALAERRRPCQRRLLMKAFRCAVL
jgi:site-specific DNA recombinase